MFAAYFAGIGFVDYQRLKEISGVLDLEVVPLLFEGEIKNASEVNHLLEHESGLGGEKVEGIVVKKLCTNSFHCRPSFS